MIRAARGNRERPFEKFVDAGAEILKEYGLERRREAPAKITLDDLIEQHPGSE